MVWKPTEPEDIPRIDQTFIYVSVCQKSCTKYYSGQSYLANSHIKQIVGASNLGLLWL